MSTRMKDIEGVTPSQYYKVDPHKLIEKPGFNIRLDDEDYAARVESYKLMFLRGSRCPPLQVRNVEGELILVDGHLRRRAAIAAIAEGAHIMDVDVVEFKGNDTDAVTFMLQSGQGRTWSPIELADGYRRLARWNWTTAEIAAVIGKTPQHVLDMLELSQVPHDIRGMVESGEVAATLAVKVVRKEGENASEILANAVSNAKSVGKARATEKHVKAVGGVKLKPKNHGEQPLVDEIRRQVNEAGIEDDTLDDHVFHIEGRLLRSFLQGA